MQTETPFLDFDAIDLDTTVVEKDEVLELLRQRNRFELVDGILHLDTEGGLIVGYKEIRSDDWWTTDHIPGRPLFPGVLMIESAAQMCTYHFMRSQNAGPETFVGFAGLDDVRFRATVVPDSRLVIAGRVRRVRSGMFIYDARGYVDRALAFEAVIRGVVV
ncbi:MAG: 3-hydroxyacyl-ACP dehydratase FabZ family protein [Planctomycetota bacterium]